MTDKFLETYKERDPNQVCAADEWCDRTVLVGQGLCDCHYRMQRIYGRTIRINRRRGEGTVTADGYRTTSTVGGVPRKMEHIAIAEKALGRPLPPGAVVHHVTEDPLDNHGPWKLVICPDQAYHMLIHRLMKEKGISFRKNVPDLSEVNFDDL